MEKLNDSIDREKLKGNIGFIKRLPPKERKSILIDLYTLIEKGKINISTKQIYNILYELG